MNKVHFNSFPTYSQGFSLGIGACGVSFEAEDYLYCTLNKKKVTCGNCKRTKIVRSVPFIKRMTTRLLGFLKRMLTSW